MAITGLFMVLFVVGHLLGNLSIFAGPNGLNAYAAKLQSMAPVVWGTRIVMLVSVVLHAAIGIQVTTENSAAKPTKYAVDNKLRATFAGRTMIWTGVILGAFIVYHLLHFTFRVTPNLVLGVDAANRFDVYTMVVTSLKSTAIALVYVIGMVALFLHLSHGIQSTFQSLGLANAPMLSRYTVAGKVASAAFLVGYGSIPVLVVIGILTQR
jgi:succinate dehydrogenase / fumarate reductase cytochrome b subunit